MPNVHFSFRRGAGDVPEILYGKVEIKPTLAFARGTSLVLPAPTTLDLVNGEATANNVYPTPAPVAGQVEWAYRVKAIDTRGQSFEWMVGVPDSTGTVEFTSLPRYFETKPPLFGKGEKGDPGEAATIQIGTTSSGTTPSVTNSGTNQAAILNFVLPKGDKGDRGDGVPAGGTALQYLRKDAAGAVTEWATLDKSSVGLSNVDNTSDADKPLSTAMEEALGVMESGEESRLVSKMGEQGSPLQGYLNNLYVKKNTSYVNVQDFGVRPDGETDYTSQIQEAIDFAYNNGIGVVLFPPAKLDYQCQNVTLRSDLEYVGFGAKIRPLTYNAFRGLSGSNTGYGGSVSNIKFVGLEFRGDFDLPDSSAAITLHHADNVKFVWCRWIEAIRGGHAIDLAGCRNVLVESCLFEGFHPTTGREYAEAIQIDHSLALSVSNMDAAASYDGLPCLDVLVTKCTFKGYTKNGVSYKAPNPIGSHTTTEQHHKNIALTYSVVDGGWATGSTSSINAWVHFQGVESLKIVGNRFYGQGVAAHVIKLLTYNTGIAPQDYSNPSATGIAIEAKPQRDILVSDNLFEDFTATSNTALITLNGRSGLFLHNAHVLNNSFKNNYPLSGTGNQGSASITTTYAQGLKVIGNSCERVRSLLFASNIKNSVISANSLDRAYWVALAVEGVETRGVVISENTFMQTGSSIYVNQAKGAVISANTIHNSLPGTAYAGYAQALITVAESIGVGVQNNNIILDTAYVPNGVLFRTNTSSSMATANILIGMSSGVTVDGTSSASTTNNVTS